MRLTIFNLYSRLRTKFIAKKRIIDRYELSSDGSVIIDVSVEKIEDLYNYFDRKAPYLKKDLDQELADYLIDCVREIGNSGFIIRISLEHLRDEQRERVRKSIRNFFMYLDELEHRKMRMMFRNSLMLFGVGLAILAVSIVLNKHISSSSSVVGTVFAEGLTIAAWVALWEALATVLIEWYPRHRDILLYRSIAGSQVVFHRFPANENT